jgi:hypothetical protein
LSFRADLLSLRLNFFEFFPYFLHSSTVNSAFSRFLNVLCDEGVVAKRL